MKKTATTTTTNTSAPKKKDVLDTSKLSIPAPLPAVKKEAKEMKQAEDVKEPRSECIYNSKLKTPSSNPSVAEMKAKYPVIHDSLSISSFIRGVLTLHVLTKDNHMLTIECSGDLSKFDSESEACWDEWLRSGTCVISRTVEPIEEDDEDDEDDDDEEGDDDDEEEDDDEDEEEQDKRPRGRDRNAVKK